MLRCSETVAPEPDLGAAARAVSNLTDRGPALLFDDIEGYEHGEVALNVVGSRPNHALMLGSSKDTPFKEQLFEFSKRWKDYPVEVERRDDPPWQEHVLEAGIDLFHLLPLFRLNRWDVGCYIDEAVVVSCDPDEPQNAGGISRSPSPSATNRRSPPWEGCR